MRTTKQSLNILVKHLNEITDSPLETYVENPETGKLDAQVGNWHLDWAYGGVRLDRISDASGAVSCPINTGYVSKPELAKILRAFIEGIQTGRKGEL